MQRAPPQTPPLCPLKTFKIGEFCNARWSGDGQPYRAKIEAIAGNRCHHANRYMVNYVDFGETEWRTITELM